MFSSDVYMVSVVVLGDAMRFAYLGKDLPKFRL